MSLDRISQIALIIGHLENAPGNERPELISGTALEINDLLAAAENRTTDEDTAKRSILGMAEALLAAVEFHGFDDCGIEFALDFLVYALKREIEPDCPVLARAA